MLLSILLRTFLPFLVPVTLILIVIFMARNRFRFLQVVPVWVWFAGIGVFLLIWLIVALLKWRAERKSAEAIEEGLGLDAGAGADVSPARRSELEEIQKNMKEAIATLKRSPQGKKALYTIPWYVIIGPPAIGKTTAILNSGLNFPNMTTAKRLRGQGGTRNCDWWFSSDAILLDTAGRFAQSADRSGTEEEWFGFLDLLKRHRRKAPLNGLILGYSMETLVQNDDARVITDARELRQRLDEIMARLGWSFPVYLLFTKSDLISGFTDFFSTLAPIERQQVWGSSFDLTAAHAQHPAQSFLAEFDVLLARIREIRARRVVAAERGDAWGRVFMFPEEMGALRAKLHLFIETLFEHNPFTVDQPLFRGAFFSSGRQMGRPLDTVVAKIQAILGGGGAETFTEEQAETEDAYFVRDLFTKVFRADQDLSRTTRSGGRKTTQIRLVLSAAVALIAALVCLFILTSYGRLHGRMKDALASVQQFEEQSQGSDLQIGALKNLDRVRQRVTGSWKAGPLTAANSVKNEAASLYREGLRERVLKPMEQRIYDQLRYPRGMDGDQARRALRTELLLLEPKQKGEIGDEKDLASGLLLFGLPDSAEKAEATDYIEAFSKDFLDEGEPLLPRESREQALTDTAYRLRETHEPNAYFESVIAGASRVREDIDLQKLVGSQRILSSDGRVRAAFTRAGWSDFVSKEFSEADRVIKEDDVLLNAAGVEPAQYAPSPDDLSQRYAEAFPQEWARFFESIRLRSHGSCSDAKDDYSELKSPNSSPLLRLLKQVSNEAEVGGQGSFFKSKQLEGVGEAMRPLTEFLQAPEGGKAPIDAYTENLYKVYDLIAQCDKGKPLADLDDSVLRIAPETIKDYIRGYPVGDFGQALQRLLVQPIDQASQILRVTSGKRTVADAQSKWTDLVAGVYQDKLAGRYPFGSGQRGANVNDVVAFFQSGGPLDQFRDYLEQAKVTPGGATERALRKASDIRSSFGLEGGLSASFNVKILPPRSLGTSEGDANLARIDRITLTVDGNRVVRLSSTPSENLHWSSQDDDVTCSLTLEQTSASRVIGKKEGDDSIWSLFRLIDQAKVQPKGDHYVLTWTFPDAGVAVDCELKMRSGGAECPFLDDSAFRTFRLPDRYDQ
jgi:type VI secretion system IcmF/VasK family protein